MSAFVYFVYKYKIDLGFKLVDSFNSNSRSYLAKGRMTIPASLQIDHRCPPLSQRL